MFFWVFFNEKEQQEWAEYSLYNNNNKIKSEEKAVTSGITTTFKQRRQALRSHDIFCSLCVLVPPLAPLRRVHTSSDQTR